MQVVVYGAGAVGSLVGARLQESGANVSLIGRRPHVDAIQANGLLVKEPDQSRLVWLPATTVLADPADIILLTAKSQDVQEACRTIARLDSDATRRTGRRGRGQGQSA